MKLTPIATAVFLAAASGAFAQSTDVPKHSCEPKPAYPGLAAMKSDVEVKAFQDQMAKYKECIVAYIGQRKSSIKAHEAAESAAAKEYNETMAKIRTDQEAAMKASEAARKPADKSDAGTSKGKY